MLFRSCYSLGPSMTMEPKILKIESVGSRFKIHHFLTRFGTTEYFVLDAEAISDAEVRAGKRPPVVFQTDSLENARNFTGA